MTDSDVSGWSVKQVYKDDVYQVELRKGGCFAIIAGPDGYNHNFFTSVPDRWGRSTKGKNVHLSMNGPQQWTWEDYESFQKAIAFAREMFRA